jgi:RNA polymerase sigma-70 factor (ECF subfamily)
MSTLATEIDALLQQDEKDGQRLAQLLVDHYYPYLHRLAFSFLGDAAEADDAVQDGLLRALDRLDAYEPGTNLRGWLATIVVNRSRDMLRRRKVRLQWRRLTQRLGGAGRPAEDRALHGEARSALWEAVDQLDEKHRLPILLYYANGFSVSDIASMLDVREGTIHSRLHNARNRLANILAMTDNQDLVLEILHE